MTRPIEHSPASPLRVLLVHSVRLTLAAAVVLGMQAGGALAQYPRDTRGKPYSPIDQATTPGEASRWLAATGQLYPPVFQPIRFVLPSTGAVAVCDSIRGVTPIEDPVSQVAVMPGHVYRLLVNDLPEFPGVDFYPSIELVDRLHPPAGQADNFPVEIELTVDELEAANRGQLVTKVIYVEQPDRIPLTVLNEKTRVTDVPADSNVFAHADVLGRPLAIVRLGGRLPDPHQPDPGFFGPGGPLQPSQPTVALQGAKPLAGKPKEGSAMVRVSRQGGAPRVESAPAADSGVRWTSAEVPCENCPPDPRQPVFGCDPYAVGQPGPDLLVQPSPRAYPDEYLCDGGDRGWPVHYPAGTRDGLATEDTVGEFTDHTGRERVAPSNRVCFYAPRCSAVRTISRPHQSERLDEIGGLAQSRGGQSLLNSVEATQRTKLDPTGRLLVRSRAGGLESESLTGGVSQSDRLLLNEKLLNTFEDLGFVRTGRIHRNEAAIIELAELAAVDWTRLQSPVIAAKLETPIQGQTEQVVATFTVHDDAKSHKPGQLKITKLADRKEAQPGDEIHFTIRYDNLGPRELSSVRIVDNLTPRLEFVEGSATSSRAGTFVSEPNGEGSVILVWEFDGSLAANEGGTVGFTARVR